MNNILFPRIRRPFAWELVLVMLCLLLAGGTTPLQAQAPLDHQQALRALGDSKPAQRLEGLVRLADIGTVADADAVLLHLHDPDAAVRHVALVVVWRLWGRSGDAAIDALYTQGMDRMQSGDLPAAVEVFSDIIGRRPAFAEAWNKRATAYFMLGQYELSMRDCEEVLKRVPQHFGAMSGYAMMLAERGEPERALEQLERAHRVNPNMVNGRSMIEQLRREVEAKRRKTT